jgi:hypothetical protein
MSEFERLQVIKQEIDGGPLEISKKGRWFLIVALDGTSSWLLSPSIHP